MKASFYNRSLVLFLLSFSCWTWAQIQISGKVLYRNKPIKDINITLKDTYDGATTDANGDYTFTTTESGPKVLVFTSSSYEDIEKPITIETTNLNINVDLKEKISEINAVIVSAGSMEASDKKRSTVLLTPLDIYTTAGANGQVTSALGFLPGVQKVGESEGVFVRGGTAGETKIFIDGSLVNNYFSNSVPGIAGRDRFNTSLFKGNIFSTGGYSAIYGQALSSILVLESVDLPETTSYDFGISPIFLSANYQKLNQQKDASWGVSAAYSNLGLMTKLFNYNTDFTRNPQGFNSDANFRIKTKKGGFIKYFGSFQTSQMAVSSLSLEPNIEKNNVALDSKYTFHTLSYREKFGRYLLNLSTSYTYNQNNLDFSNLSQSEIINPIKSDANLNYVNAKAILERKINKISAVRMGFELNNSDEKTTYFDYQKHYKDLISSVFAETDLGFSNRFSAKIGARVENSSYLQKTNFSPRVAVAYKISDKIISSFAYGIFYQNPESKYLNSNAPITYQRADHYVFQLQHNTDGRSLRLEAFYKNYDQLIKTNGSQYIQTAFNNSGSAYAKGAELFWRDKKSIPSIDYWISYSYLDSKRDFLNYPFSLSPNFAAKHSLSVIAKKFVMPWKTGFNLSYTYSSGRPYYDIITDNGANILRHEGKLKDYNALNFSINYVPSVGKKDSKSFIAYVLSINNILGNKNVYGYNYSANGNTRSSLVPPVNTFIFVGAFLSFGVDKTDEAINNNL